MLSSVRPVADGAPGIAQIVAECNRVRDLYGRLPVVRAAALWIAPPTVDHDQARQLAALAAFVRAAVRYQADPFNAEYIQTPDVMLSQIQEQGHAAGDCDCHCVLLASLCEALGMAAEIIPATLGAAPLPNHVVCLVHLDAGSEIIDPVKK